MPIQESFATLDAHIPNSNHTRMYQKLLMRDPTPWTNGWIVNPIHHLLVTSFYMLSHNEQRQRDSNKHFVMLR